MTKSSKFLTVILSFTMAVCMLAGCGSSDKAEEKKADAKQTLTVYTPESQELINLIIPGFEKETGIKVEVIAAGTGELTKRIASETDNPIADVLMGSSTAILMPKKDLFQEYVSPNDQYMTNGFKNTTGYFTPFKADGSVLLVNKNLIGDIKVKGYADLLNPALKGKIASADAATSSSAYEHLVNMLQAMTPNNEMESDKAWNYVKQLVKNLNGKILNSSSAVHKGVADGEYTVGITYEDPACTYVKNGANVEVVYMEEGVVFAGATVEIVKNCKNLENAKKFVDYCLSKEVQDKMGTELCTRALRKDAKVGSHMKPLKDIKLLDSDRKWVADNKSRLAAKFTEVVTSVTE